MKLMFFFFFFSWYQVSSLIEISMLGHALHSSQAGANIAWAVLLGIVYGLFHVFVEGTTVLLLSPGIGQRSIGRAARVGLAYGALTGAAIAYAYSPGGSTETTNPEGSGSSRVGATFPTPRGSAVFLCRFQTASLSPLPSTRVSQKPFPCQQPWCTNV